MFKSRWRFSCKRPSIFGWCWRTLLLLVSLCIWTASYRAWHGNPFGWPNDPDVYVKKPMDPDPPAILFFGRRFCLNLNKSDAPLIQQGLPIRYAMYVYGSGSPTGLGPPWQFFEYGFVAPTWSLCAVAGAVLLLASKPRITRTLRGHCGKCNYDLQGLTSVPCPECGASNG